VLSCPLFGTNVAYRKFLTVKLPTCKILTSLTIYLLQTIS
jgi:hypothetical protein